MTAKELNLPAEFIDEVVSYYYNTVQKKLSLADHPAVWVPALGMFVVKKKTLNDLITKYRNTINFIENKEYISVGAYGIIVNKRKEMEQYIKLQDFIKEELKRKEEIKEIRKNYEQPDQTMEEPQSDC